MAPKKKYFAVDDLVEVTKGMYKGNWGKITKTEIEDQYENYFVLLHQDSQSIKFDRSALNKAYKNEGHDEEPPSKKAKHGQPAPAGCHPEGTIHHAGSPPHSSAQGHIDNLADLEDVIAMLEHVVEEPW